MLTKAELARKGRPRVLVLGAGFGGISAATGLCDALPARLKQNLDVVLVDARNYHLYTPLLFQSATGLVDPDHIAQAVRPHARKKGFEFFKAKVSSIDLPNRTVWTDAGAMVYDYLVIALGSVESYGGVGGARRHAIALRSIEDGVRIHNRIVASFESAALLGKGSPERSALLRFVVIGGTVGAELAGSILDFVSLLAQYYPGVDAPQECEVVVIEAHSRFFPGGDVALSEDVKDTLKKRGIKVLTETRVTEVSSSGVTIEDGSVINSENVFWNAGTSANAVVEAIPDELIKKHHGRILVDDYLRVPNFPEVYAIGDASASLISKHRPGPSQNLTEGEARRADQSSRGYDERYVPQTAEAAVEEGRFVAMDLSGRIAKTSRLSEAEPGRSSSFVFKERGLMLSIGRRYGLVKFKHVSFTGMSGWLIWRFVHLALISTMKGRLSVLLDWTFGSFGKRSVIQTAPIEADEEALAGDMGIESLGQGRMSRSSSAR